jgi:hypothetical protein
LYKDVTFVRTANLRLPITGDPASTEQRSGFREKMSYQVPLPRDAATQRKVEPRGYPEFFECPAEQKVTVDFAKKLVRLQEQIIKRNEERSRGKRATSRVFNSFDINYVENGVAI